MAVQKGKKQDAKHNLPKYERVKECPACGASMQYIFGEQFQCPKCGRTELSDFGKVKQFLEENGPQPAIIINQETNVSIEYINLLLRQGRIEVPDGSEIYIKCQKCGTDIRYGRYCPDCMLKIAKSVNGVMWMDDVGEKPTRKIGSEMHYLDRLKKG
ncbi:MAG: hypothetical protein ACI4EJ_06695 [Bacteroides sp.]